MTKPILEAHNLKLQYGEVVAAKDVSVSIPEGQCVGLIGPNGAGKTTLLKGLAGVIPITEGRVTFQGQDVTGKPAHALSVMGIALIPEGRLPFASMSVLENLKLPAYSMKFNKREMEERLEFVFDLFPRLKERRRQRAGSLSGGEQQMLAISRALVLKPKVLLIDEPSLGLAPIIVEQIYEVLPKLLKEGLSILLVEQSVELVFSVSSYVYVMREGTIIHSGNTAEINKAELADSYLK